MTTETCDISGVTWEKKSKWELIDQSYGATTERLKVPGGWIYHVGHTQARAVSVCFVPEPEKENK